MEQQVGKDVRGQMGGARTKEMGEEREDKGERARGGVGRGARKEAAGGNRRLCAG